MATAPVTPTSQFDYLRRKNSRLSALTNSPSRRGRQDTHRDINATTDNKFSMNGRNSASTGLTSQGPPQHSKKFVVVGDGGCGKTCLLISYSQGIFPEKYVPTVFENYITQVDYRPRNARVELALWDTAGQEEYDRLRPLSYPETDLLFVCFAIDCPNSLENVMDKWYPEVLHFCPTTPLILVGLKSDLRNKRSCIELLKTQGLTPVTIEQGRSVARKMGATYMECSSKEMIGVHEIFDTAIDIVVSADYGEKPRSDSLGEYDNEGEMAFNERRKKKRSCRIL